jgi:DNA-binding winged helix-turn-helix (wHTH) protein
MVGARAFDLLVTFAERAGELVSRDELLASVWPKAPRNPVEEFLASDSLG